MNSKMIEVNDEHLVINIEGKENVRSFKSKFRNYFYKMMLDEFIKEDKYKDEIFELQPDDKILIFREHFIDYVSANTLHKYNPTINIAHAYYKYIQVGYHDCNTNLKKLAFEYKDDNYQFVFDFTFIKEHGIEVVVEKEKEKNDIRYSYNLAKYYEGKNKEKSVEYYTKCYVQKYRTEIVLQKLCKLSDNIDHSIELFKIKPIAKLALDISVYYTTLNYLDFCNYFSQYETLRDDSEYTKEEKEKLKKIAEYMNNKGLNPKNIMKILFKIV
jgi:hypothetical protein